MALELYRKKRNFENTPEPAGKVVKRKGKELGFVIQKHAASRLHYDFRLELNGVLLSWAVPKGPSLDPKDKRLAVHVEDHPIEYGAFEGIIPPRQYGAGTVMLWDRGTWTPKEDPVTGYQNGKLKFELKGEKLKGGWVLVKSQGGRYGGEKSKSWLLFKEDDAYARRGLEAQIVESDPNSVATQRSLEEIAAGSERVWESNKSVAENVKRGAVKKVKQINPAKISGAVQSALPPFVEAQLATLAKSAPQGEGWIHEIKFDGYRMLSRLEAGAVHIYSRNRKEWTGNFSTIATALSGLTIDSAWIDGEIVSIDAQGRTSFQSLQNALSGSENDIIYVVFDLLYLNGYDLRDVSLVERKALLKRLIPSHRLIRYSDHFEVPASDFFANVCKLGLEGMISKRQDSTYHGVRDKTWLKIKCALRQEMVIGGFTNPEGSRQGFGALLLGVYDADGKLKYSGKVGTGFNDSSLVDLHRKLKELEQDKPAFVDPPKGAEARRSHWVQPELVAEVSFTEWTEDGTLRHPSFQGLREDKRARDVVREQAIPAPSAEASPDNATRPNGPANMKATKATKATKADKDVVAAIKLSNPDKVLYPEAGFTKRDLALYYEAIGDWIVPHLRDRPLTLVRCPNGWDKPCFYQRNADKAVPEVIERVTVTGSEGDALYMMANSVSAVVALLQLGTLELHPWGSRLPDLDLPDRIVLDLDPDETLAWKEVTTAVGVVRTLLENIGLLGFLKTTGGKGLHVVLPIESKLTWEEVKGFSKAIAELLVRTFPDRFTAKLSKDSRHGKIFIDYLRNAEGATAIGPYSIRAKANAPVAMPIDWTDLDKEVRFDYFNVKNVPARLKRLRRDPWAAFFTTRQSVTPAMMKAIGYRQG